ncbi:MAG TPA: hypothetical protein VK654_02590 [Nitrospirota bacterium]|nr:hypothetical protein [Nitrospirota bacterium]
MGIAFNERGVSAIKVWFWLIVLGVIIYAGVKLAMPYFDFERMKDEMTVKARLAQVLKDDEVRQALVAKAKELELPLGPENFILQRDEAKQRMYIAAAWDVEVHFPYDIYVWSHHFNAVADETMARP